MKFKSFKEIELFLEMDLDYEYDLDEVVGGEDYKIYKDDEFENMVLVVNDSYYWIIINEDNVVSFKLEYDEEERRIIEDILNL